MTSIKRKKDVVSFEAKKRPKRIEENNSETSDNDLYEPTLEEVNESCKPENVIAIKTVRQKKKEKHKERQNQQLDLKHESDEIYLNNWKNKRDEWKFIKRRQISIQQSVFDERKISEKCWPIALEYLSGSMGTARETLIKKSEELIDEMDKRCDKIDEDERLSILNSIKYQRARALLQNFA